LTDHLLLIEILAQLATGLPIMRNISMGKEGRPLGGTGLSTIVASIAIGADTIWPVSQDSCKQGSWPIKVRYALIHRLFSQKSAG
jgi:hypothetical protein